MSQEPATSQPDPVDEIVSGFRGAQIVLAANRLGLFTALADGALTAQELARVLEADRRGVRILADALVSLGLLAKSDGRYANAAPAEEYLLPGSPRSKRAMLLHTARLYERWAGLYDAVKQGRPVSDDAIDPRLLGGEREFAQAMADVGRQRASQVAEALDLSGVRRLLDLGGGPGIYALELARRHPGVEEVVVFDRPDTLEVARENARRAGLEERVSVRAGNAFEDDLGGPYDLVFTSNLVHIYSGDENRRLVARCAAALAPGGRLAIKDFLLDADRTTPAGGAIFAVNMLVSTQGGDCYTVEEVEGWMRQAGLTPEELFDLTAQSRMLVGRKGG